ncbi:hypothetical protein BC833DRAFT_570944 [Globomyces pollinis-pini]|nr:hypothetical protein BC833DRAFT_570944 [Globomyces pollinis-pini]
MSLVLLCLQSKLLPGPYTLSCFLAIYTQSLIKVLKFIRRLFRRDCDLNPDQRISFVCAPIASISIPPTLLYSFHSESYAKYIHGYAESIHGYAESIHGYAESIRIYANGMILTEIA